MANLSLSNYYNNKIISPDTHDTTAGTNVESETPRSQPDQSNTITKTRAKDFSLSLTAYWELKSKLNPDSNLLSLS